MSQTHTYTLLAVSQQTYDEIEAKLEAAKYHHLLRREGQINMHGIALVVEKTKYDPNQLPLFDPPK